ncbi:transposase [Clostridium botulinum]|nr:transposase [Clostridium botulinum]
MIDIHTHRIIYMIESRDKEDVAAWLKSFPNLNTVSREVSLIYNDAIELAHPSAVQVSDRVHLLKNLTDYCCEIIKSIMKNNIEIPRDNGVDIVLLRKKYKLDTKWEVICAVKDLDSQGFSNKEIQDVLKLNFRTIKKYLSVKYEEKKKYDKKPKYIVESERKLNIKLEIQKEIRKLVEKGISYRRISNLLSIDKRTVKKYV